MLARIGYNFSCQKIRKQCESMNCIRRDPGFIAQFNQNQSGYRVFPRNFPVHMVHFVPVWTVTQRHCMPNCTLRMERTIFITFNGISLFVIQTPQEDRMTSQGKSNRHAHNYLYTIFAFDSEVSNKPFRCVLLIAFIWNIIVCLFHCHMLIITVIRLL